MPDPDPPGAPPGLAGDPAEPPPVPVERFARWVRTRRRSFGSFHPWVYRRMIKETSPGLADGEEVQVLGAEGTPIGRGLYHRRSMIAVRILERDPARPLDERFFRERIERAVALRRETLGLDRSGDAYRIVHSEGDGLSGLVVDRYGGVLVFEYFSFGLHARHALLRDLLLESYPGAECVVRVDAALVEREGIPPPPPVAAREVEIRENKMRFLVRPGGGHKTGFFLDQRENRERFATLVRGRKVLDCFTYTGGFAIAARTAGKAREVVGVDLDEEAILGARRNAALNRAEVEWIHADAFKYLRRQRNAVEPFEAIVLDPAKWALSRDRIPEARQRYLDLNLAGIRALRRGGILLTCSCSGLICEEDFLGILRAAAVKAGRELQVFHVGGAAPDHPVSIHCPESRYLKAVFARVS